MGVLPSRPGKGGIMWDSFVFSANIVLPSFILIFLGRMVTWIGLMSRDEMDKIGKLTFTYLLSTKIFLDIAGNSPEAFSNYSMVGFCFAAIVVLFRSSGLWRRVRSGARNRWGRLCKAAFAAALQCWGFPWWTLLPEAKGSRCALLLAMTAIVFNVLACLVLTKPEENGPLKVKMGKTLKSIVKTH